MEENSERKWKMEISVMENIIMFMATLNANIFIFTLLFIALDVITGITQAIANRCVESEKMKNGFWHKLAIIFALFVAGMIDCLVQIGIGQQLGFVTPIFECACLYIIVMELTSIMENIVKMNPELKDTKFMGLFSGALPSSDESDTIEDDGAATED